MRQDEIEKIKEKVALNISAKTFQSDIDTELIQAGYDYALTHLPEGIELTDEIDGLIRHYIDLWSHRTDYTLDLIMPELMNEITSKLSPYLLKLKEENERLKKDNDEWKAKYESSQGALTDYIVAQREAVQQERERIGQFLYDTLPSGEVDTFKLIKVLGSIIEKLQDGQALEQEYLKQNPAPYIEEA